MSTGEIVKRAVIFMYELFLVFFILLVKIIKSDSRRR